MYPYPIENQLPPYLLNQTAENLSGALRGELPKDVQDQIASRAAELGVASGMPGSENAQYRGLRDLGLTSLSRMQHAEDLIAPQFVSPTTMANFSHQYNMGNMSRPSPFMSHAPGFGSVPAAVQQNRSAPAAQTQQGPLNPWQQKGNSYQSTIGDIMGKYLGGGRGTTTGFTSQFSNPMSSTGRNDDSWMSGLAELGLLPDNETASSGGSSAPGFYAGSKAGYWDSPQGNEQFESNLDAIGLMPDNEYAGSYTGDIYGYEDGDYYG